jgi:hypothetical protein
MDSAENCFGWHRSFEPLLNYFFSCFEISVQIKHDDLYITLPIRIVTGILIKLGPVQGVVPVPVPTSVLVPVSGQPVQPLDKGGFEH